MTREEGRNRPRTRSEHTVHSDLSIVAVMHHNLFTSTVGVRIRNPGK